MAPVPPNYIRPLALWNPRLGFWSLYDRYHRIPLLPVPCKTLEAVGNIATRMMADYLRFPIVGESGSWDACCADESGLHPKTCVHGMVRL